MNTKLYEIRDFIRQLIEATRSVISFDMFVVDENLLRIAGTGKYEQLVGLHLPDDCANGHVLKTGKAFTNYRPLEHEVCKTCKIREICFGESMIIYPIQRDNSTIGAITIGSFSSETKEKQKKMEKNLLSFLANLTEIILTKIKEKESTDRLLTIVQTVDEGIVLTDSEGNVILCNDVMKNGLIMEGENISKLIKENYFNHIFRDGQTFDNRELNLGNADGNKRLFVSTKLIQPENKKTETLFTFKDNKEVKNIAYKLLADHSHLDINLDNIIGASELINKTKQIIVNAAKFDSNIMITGESGTGKELFSRAIHHISPRKKGPFIAVNCAAIPENLLESELFGYEDGAFTGAKKGGKPGKFELADNGTILLDEIGDLSLHLQPKLLRALEQGFIERVGGIVPIKLNVRVIAATNKDLEAMIKEGTFREDLFYRLNVIPINIPPLRRRSEDILVLSRYFLNKYNNKFVKEITGFTEDVQKALLLYDWPGNVRELENTIEYCVNVETEHLISFNSLPAKFKFHKDYKNRNLKELEVKLIKELIYEHGLTVNGKKRIAKEMGISVSTLYRRLKELGLFD